MSKSRVFLYILLSFIGGVAAGSFTNVPVFFIWLGCLAGTAIILRNLLKRNLLQAVLGFLVVVFFLGVLRMDLTEKSKPDLEHFYGKRLFFQGIIWEEPDGKERYLEALKEEVTKEILQILQILTVGKLNVT